MNRLYLKHPKNLAPLRELKDTLLLAWPLIIAQLAQMALFTTDVIMMGWLGPEFLASGTLATAFFHPFMLLGIGILSAVAPMVAQARGARQIKSVRRSARQGFWVALAVSALLVPLLWQAEWGLNLLGQDATLAEMAGGYMHYAVWSFIPALLFVVLRCLLSAHGVTSVILWITLVGVAVNALGNYALMFGNFGFPRLELAGAGISTTVVNTLMFLLTLGYILRHRKFKRYHILLRFWRPDWQRFRDIIRVGLPFGLMLMAETGLFAAAAMLMGWLGTAELAAHAVALQCAGIAFMVPLGLSQATTIRVGLAYGAGDTAGVGTAGWVNITLALGFMSLTCLLFWLMPQFFVGLFLDPSLAKNEVPFLLAVSYLGIAALFQLVDGAQVVAGAALRGLNDTAMPMVIAIAGFWGIGFPVAYICGFVLEMRGIGIWLGLASALAFVAVVLSIRFALRERLALTSKARITA